MNEFRMDEDADTTSTSKSTISSTNQPTSLRDKLRQRIPKVEKQRNYIILSPAEDKIYTFDTRLELVRFLGDFTARLRSRAVLMDLTTETALNMEPINAHWIVSQIKAEI